MDVSSMYGVVPKEPRKFKKGFERLKAMFQLNYKNAVKHPIESIKWMIALYLDENPKYCWGELVLWVQYDSFWSLRSHNFKCECTKETGYYCGKCEC